MAESDPTTNQNKPEEDQTTDLGTEDQVGIAPANNDFNITDLRRPLQKPLKGQEKPVEQVARKDISPVAGTNMASGMPAGGSVVSRVAQAGLGLKNAFQAGFRSSRNPEPEQDQGANQKQTKDKKTSDLKIAKDATKAVAQAATGNYVGAVLNGLKSAYALTKKHPKEIALGCALPIAIVVVIPVAIFILGLLNMMPGSKSGTTFAKSEMPFNSLNNIRKIAPGDDRNAALMNEIRENGAVELTNELDNLQSEVEQAETLKGQDLTDFQGLVKETKDKINQLASLQNTDDPTSPEFTVIVSAIGSNIEMIMDSFLGQPSKVGFYNLPDLSYYVRKEPNQSNNRQWGRKELIFTIINTAKEFQDRYPKYKIRITDMQFREGGPMKPHSSHQCGNDADITVSYNNQNAPSNVLIANSSEFNSQMAKDLADIFFQNGVSEIGFEYPDNDYNKFKNWANHKDHFHIRIANKTNSYSACLQ